MGKTVGLLLTGHAPCRDVADELVPYFGPDVDVIQAGALDGRGPDGLSELHPPAPQQSVLVRLADGGAVAVDAERLAPLLQARLERLEAWGADVVILASTAVLPPLAPRRVLVEPWRLLPAAVGGLLPRGRLGVVTPALRAPERYRSKWEGFAGRAVFAEADPRDPRADWSAVGRRLAEADVDLVVLDAMTYPRERRTQLARLLRRPVLQAAALVAAVVGELL